MISEFKVSFAPLIAILGDIIKLLLFSDELIVEEVKIPHYDAEDRPPLLRLLLFLDVWDCKLLFCEFEVFAFRLSV